jgi:hypothetical protein
VILGDDLRFEAPASVPRSLQIDLAQIAFQLLFAAAVAGVIAIVADRVMLIVTDMIGQFSVHCPL